VVVGTLRGSVRRLLWMGVVVVVVVVVGTLRGSVRRRLWMRVVVVCRLRGSAPRPLWRQVVADRPTGVEDTDRMVLRRGRVVGRDRFRIQLSPGRVGSQRLRRSGRLGLVGVPGRPATGVRRPVEVGDREGTVIRRGRALSRLIRPALPRVRQMVRVDRRAPSRRVNHTGPRNSYSPPIMTAIDIWSR
jgi:hypothetical protein